jgi:hypothetical protein
MERAVTGSGVEVGYGVVKERLITGGRVLGAGWGIDETKNSPPGLACFNSEPVSGGKT